MTIPRNEYPRPQFVRKDWINLNGEWSYTFDFSRSGDARNLQGSTGFDGRITVPFCPESKLSGVGCTDFIEMMWYQRTIDIPAGWADKKVLLHFGGVDYICIVYVDGQEVGRHTGGASPFTLNITKFVTAGKNHNLVVRVDTAQAGEYSTQAGNSAIRAETAEGNAKTINNQTMTWVNNKFW